LPIELSGVIVTINGVACGLKSVSRHEIVFVAPPGLLGSTAGQSYPVVVTNNGVAFKGNTVFVPTRPDIISKNPIPSPGGRALAFNVTNTVHTTEPFTVSTLKIRGGRMVPSVIRLSLTGVQSVGSAIMSIRIGSVTIVGTPILSGATLVEPGVYTVDFQLPTSLRGAGDQPIVVDATVEGVTYSSRLDDTTSFIRIL
jgi:uncharacterized protein (TIGR03437 family)